MTSTDDANRLVELGVGALGLNFWPSSKRYCDPSQAAEVAGHLQDQILRVGVFVNNAPKLAEELLDEGLIDAVQLHGDETEDEIHYFLARQTPVIRAVGANRLPNHMFPPENFALLIDTPAGKDYGGTGKIFDWSLAADFSQKNPDVPFLLAGGLNPENATAARDAVCPAALDVASGAESSPGVKDFTKVRALLYALS